MLSRKQQPSPDVTPAWPGCRALPDAACLCLQGIDNGGFLVQNCVNLNMHGPVTLTYATAALGFSQVYHQACDAQVVQVQVIMHASLPL